MFESYMPNRTLSVFDKIGRDFKRFCVCFDFVMQIVFILFYIYSIFTNKSNLRLIIINSVLLTLCVSYFIFFAITFRNEKKHIKNVRKNVNKIFRYSKLFVHSFTIGFSIYEIVNFPSTDLKIILTAITIIGFFCQIIFEITRSIVDKYLILLTTSIKMDIETIKNSNAGKAVDVLMHPKRAIIGAIDKPVGALARVFSGNSSDDESINEVEEQVVYTRKEQKTRETIDKLANNFKEEKAQENQAKKAVEDAQEKEKFSEQVNKLKKHIGIIFNKNKDDNE